MCQTTLIIPYEYDVFLEAPMWNGLSFFHFDHSVLFALPYFEHVLEDQELIDLGSFFPISMFTQLLHHNNT